MTLRIAEIFGPTIQGEGSLIGVPSLFVRAGGCDYRCSWCDSPHAVDSRFRHSWQEMTPEMVMARLEALSGGMPMMVSLSGGNPAIQDFGPLIARGRAGIASPVKRRARWRAAGSPIWTCWCFRQSLPPAASGWIGRPSTPASPRQATHRGC